MIYIGNNEYPIYLGDSEIPTIYCGEELIYPVNLGTLTGITMEDLAWVEDVPASGGTATEENCSYKVVAHYDSDKSRSVTNKATVTGSLVVSATTAETREMVGVLQLTATYEGFTATGSIDVYQDSVGPIPSDYQEIQYIYNQSQIAYIPTDIYFTSDMWFEFKLRNLGHSQLPERHIFGGSLFDTQVQSGAHNTWFIRGNRTSSQRLQVSSALPANTDVTAVLYKGNNNVVLNGVNKGTLTPKGATDTYKAYFFTFQEKAPADDNSNRLGLNAYLYYYIVGSNTSGEELYHFVPVRRKSDNLVGLYEIINGAFYGPGNSNTFVAGPDV